MTNVELVETRISPDILDTIGKSFKFRHAGGIAEWLKNALDNYLRLRSAGEEPLEGSWPVLVNLLDAPSQASGPNLAVVDFGGTTLANIQEFFLNWGSRTAATLGRRVKDVDVTGGHGNGGKFYMREMWRDGARLLTFRDGKATSLVVQRREDGMSGFWEAKDEPTDWRRAFDRACPKSERLGGADPIVAYLGLRHPELVAELDGRTRGFTVLVGRRAVQVLSSNDVVRGGRWDRQRLVDSLVETAQARRPIRELEIAILANGTEVLRRLQEDQLETDPAWEAEAIPVPSEPLRSVGARNDVIGTLTLQKSLLPLTGRLKDRNALTVLDDGDNPVARYLIPELPLPGHSPILDFIFAELSIDDPAIDRLVQNDREHLVASGPTRLLLDWVAGQLWLRVAAVEEAKREHAKRRELELASILNDELNKHASRFLEALQTQIFVDVVDDPTGGGQGPLGNPNGGKGGRGTGGEGQGGKKEVPGTQQQQRRPRFPQVLLSSFDPDPATNGTASKHLTSRHPPLEQDDTDKRFNIWWINTDHVFAQAALQRGGAKGVPFRSYQLHMFRDVVQREALRYRQRREAELSLDRVENELSDVSNRFLGELPYELVTELLD
jgi:hypothetical protein